MFKIRAPGQIRVAVIFWTAQLCVLTLFGQEVSTRIYTIQDGLPQMKVSSIYKDERGYLWVGTRNGLCYFDGESFTSVDEGLLSNRIHGIDGLTTGEVAIMTSAGICLYDGVKMQTFPYEFPGVKYDFVVDGKDCIWILGHREQVLWQFSSGQYLRRDTTSSHAFMGYDKQEEAVFICQVRKILKINADDDPEVIIDQLPHGITTFVGSADQRFAVAYFEEQNIILAHIEGNNLVPVATIENGRRKDVVPNQIWIVRNSQFYMPAPHFNSHGTGHYFNITSAHQDADGNLWVGSDQGLALYFAPVFESYPYALLPDIWSVQEDNQGTYWFGSYGHGLFEWPSASNTPVAVPEFQNNFQAFFPGGTTDIQNNIYFPNAHGLFVLSEGSFERAIDESVFAVCHDPIRRVIISGVLGGVRIDQQGFTRPTYYRANEGVHPCDYIQAITVTSDGNYWFGSYSGLTRLWPDHDSIRQYTFENGRLPDKGIFAVCEDKTGTLWFGGDAGLMRYNQNTDSIIAVTSSVLSEQVKSLIMLDETHLLVGTKSGLFTFNTRAFREHRSLRIHPLNALGYSGIEPGFNAFYKDSKGKIWITSATTVNVLDPKELRLDGQPMSIRISYVDGLALPLAAGTHEVNLPPGQNNPIISYEAVGARRPPVTMYQYRLDDQPWSDWTQSRNMAFTDMSHGLHTFRVRPGPTDLAIDHSPVAVVRFWVDLPFYQRTWFSWMTRIAAFLLSAAIIWFYIQRRQWKRKYQRQMSEAKYLRNQLLLSELNPHFIFNVLASIQHKVLAGKPKDANRQIIQLARLIRNFLNASYKANFADQGEYEIALTEEIALLKSYIRFEQEKSDDHFTAVVTMSEECNNLDLRLPPMLIQPFVENAIKHGLLPAAQGGVLRVGFDYLEGVLTCEIEDNGVGRSSTRIHKPGEFGPHQSLGSGIVEERIAILNELGHQIHCQTTDAAQGGTRVVIRIKDEPE